MNDWMNDPSRWQSKPPPVAAPVAQQSPQPMPQPAQRRPLLALAGMPMDKQTAAIAAGSDAAQAIFDRAGVVR